MPAIELNVQEASQALESMIETSIVPFLWGPPGIGKSSIVRQLAERKKWPLIDLRLSLLNPVDLRGLPVVDKEHKTAEWFKPGFLPDSSDTKPGILFLDEINLAPQSVQAAAYQLILDKKLGEYIFPKSWRIIAAGNRETDKANVFKLSAPLANRFIHFTVVPEWQVWREWAKKSKLQSQVIDYISTHPNNFLKMPDAGQKAFPSPRTWQFISEILAAFQYKDGTEPDNLLTNAIMGAVGEGAGKEFIAYIKDYSLQNIEAMVKEFYDTGKIKMPNEQSKRFLVIRRVYSDYRNRDINNAIYMKFKSFLTAEETKAIGEFEKENDAAIKSSFGY